ncbi:MAG: hypothetical protein K9G67_07715 [Bacteroidales bacterium]|nr:hypothetical protein [Bacteroidales bacterium]MCF8345479.1 hypothetical protein [Bacteroidales bacterium]MCF8352623.1 hypothetical protein [Bacteroidales bacterium]MCF8376227.1 hypothetical protein [Bacteroidales bacterium]
MKKISLISGLIALAFMIGCGPSAVEKKYMAQTDSLLNVCYENQETLDEFNLVHYDSLHANFKQMKAELGNQRIENDTLQRSFLLLAQHFHKYIQDFRYAEKQLATLIEDLEKVKINLEEGKTNEASLDNYFTNLKSSVDNLDKKTEETVEGLKNISRYYNSVAPHIQNVIAER